MAEFRRRKAGRHKSGYHQKNGFPKGGGHASEGITIFGWGIQQFLFSLCGILFCVFCGYKHTMYVNLIHENNLWFSNIKVSWYCFWKLLESGPSFTIILSRDMTKPTKWLCAQRRLRSAWASADAQADLSLRWAHTQFVGFVMSWLMWFYW